MKLKNSDYAKNARKRILIAMRQQELDTEYFKRVLHNQFKDAEYVQFEEIK